MARATSIAFDLYNARNKLPFDKTQTELERLDAEIVRSRSLPREPVRTELVPALAAREAKSRAATTESPQDHRNRLGRQRVRSGSRPTEPRGGRIEHR